MSNQLRFSSNSRVPKRVQELQQNRIAPFQGTSSVMTRSLNSYRYIAPNSCESIHHYYETKTITKTALAHNTRKEEIPTIKQEELKRELEEVESKKGQGL